jgi:hypothetical protein
MMIEKLETATALNSRALANDPATNDGSASEGRVNMSNKTDVQRNTSAVAEGLGLHFPRTFKCLDCDNEHVAHFMAAFVLDSQENWYFDLGPRKGWTTVNAEQHAALMELLCQRTQLVCPKHAGDAVVASESSEFKGWEPRGTVVATSAAIAD